MRPTESEADQIEAMNSSNDVTKSPEFIPNKGPCEYKNNDTINIGKAKSIEGPTSGGGIVIF